MSDVGKREMAANHRHGVSEKKIWRKAAKMASK